MSKFDEKVAGYKANMEKLGIKYDEDKLIACTKACGPSIYNADGETVSGSDQSELDTVKKNYLIKKLGLSESDDLDSVVNHVIEKMGKSNRNKYRAIFYYLCSEKVGKFPS
jgi:ribosome assembly protein YihI (activator of Der GTPase)